MGFNQRIVSGKHIFYAEPVINIMLGRKKKKVLSSSGFRRGVGMMEAQSVSLSIREEGREPGDKRFPETLLWSLH